MRFYEQAKDGTLKVLKTVTTPSAARKRIQEGRNIYPSLTTVLGIAPKDEHFQRWCDERLVELARKFPNKSVDELVDDRWGFAQHPDGHTVRSREFGTELHAQLEEANRHLKEGSDYRNETWDKWVQPWLAYCEKEGVEPVEMEYRVCDEGHNVAGMLDLVAKCNGTFFLFDYKCRFSGANDKDCQQLALSADIIEGQWGLGHTPKIRTVLINPETAELKIHRWTAKKQLDELYRAIASCEYFNRYHKLR